MSYDEAVTALRRWQGQTVVVRLEPEGTIMTGALSELDAAGLDGALFAVDEQRHGGVAVALFRDAVERVVADDREIVVSQGRVTVTVTRAG